MQIELVTNKTFLSLRAVAQICTVNELGKSRKTTTLGSSNWKNESEKKYTQKCICQETKCHNERTRKSNQHLIWIVTPNLTCYVFPFFWLCSHLIHMSCVLICSFRHQNTKKSFEHISVHIGNLIEYSSTIPNPNCIPIFHPWTKSTFEKASQRSKWKKTNRN